MVGGDAHGKLASCHFLVVRLAGSRLMLISEPPESERASEELIRAAVATKANTDHRSITHILAGQLPTGADRLPCSRLRHQQETKKWRRQIGTDKYGVKLLTGCLAADWSGLSFTRQPIGTCLLAASRQLIA